MRQDGRCYWVTARGKQKCFTFNNNVYRICPCANFQQLLGRDHEEVDLTVGSYDIHTAANPVTPTTAGWYREGGESCRSFCDRGGLTCDTDVHTKFRGADMMQDLESAFGGDLCDQYVDTADKAQAPYFQGTAITRCWVNEPTSNGSKFNCNTVSRTDGNYRFCYCS